jgi:Novel STAND NTPase 1
LCLDAGGLVDCGSPCIADQHPETCCAVLQRLGRIGGSIEAAIEHLQGCRQRRAHSQGSPGPPDAAAVTVEPAHEALLRQWGLLQGWLAEDTGLLTVLDGIKRGARDWEQFLCLIDCNDDGRRRLQIPHP